MSRSPAREAIPRRRLHEEVSDRLLAAIRAREFEPGGELPSEQELMARFGVGRSAVREALRQLETMGLVEISHGERSRLLEPSAERVLQRLRAGIVHTLAAAPENLEHLKAARVMLEAGLVGLAARQANETGLTAVREAIAKGRAAHAAGDTAAFVAADMAFHRAIAAMTGNPLFPVIAQAIFEWLSVFHVNQVHVHGLEHLTLAEHEEIAARLAARDAAGAEDALRRHLTRANKLYALHGAAIRRRLSGVDANETGRSR